MGDKRKDGWSFISIYKREVHTVFGDEHGDAFLIGPLKTPGVSAWRGEPFSGSDTEMIDTKAGSEDKKHTKRCE